MIDLTAHAEGTVMKIRAKPGARKNAVVGEHQGALCIAVTAAPERGKANAAIVEVLADFLDCRPARLTLVAGATSRQKSILVHGFSVAELREKIEARSTA